MVHPWPHEEKDIRSQRPPFSTGQRRWLVARVNSSRRAVSCLSISFYRLLSRMRLALRVAFCTLACGRQSEDQHQQLHDLKPGQLMLTLLRSL